jgi:hypothetical protein
MSPAQIEEQARRREEAKACHFSHFSDGREDCGSILSPQHTENGRSGVETPGRPFLPTLPLWNGRIQSSAVSDVPALSGDGPGCLGSRRPGLFACTRRPARYTDRAMHSERIGLLTPAAGGRDPRSVCISGVVRSHSFLTES